MTETYGIRGTAALQLGAVDHQGGNVARESVICRVLGEIRQRLDSVG